jgi:hypothetical protein
MQSVQKHTFPEDAQPGLPSTSVNDAAMLNRYAFEFMKE